MLKNVYEVLVSNRLKDIKIVIRKQFDPELYFGIKIRRLNLKWNQTSITHEPITGKQLMEFKLSIKHLDDNEMDFAIKTGRLGIFNFYNKLWFLPFTHDNICSFIIEN
jgi:hypothetical protein